MLIEHRAYTMRPGGLDIFVDAQAKRGFGPPMQGVMERLIGYFSTVSGPTDQVVHLWRYDNYEDWIGRLHAIYGRPELEGYFKTVRSLMVAQENKFLAPAPLAELTPYWGNGKDWLPGVQPPQLSAGEAALIEETTLILLPGTVPAYWQAFREHALQASEATQYVLGSFASVVGRQHQLLHYRHYAGLAECEAHKAALAQSEPWRSFQKQIGPSVASSETKLLRSCALPEMSPFFR